MDINLVFESDVEREEVLNSLADSLGVAVPEVEATLKAYLTKVIFRLGNRGSRPERISPKDRVDAVKSKREILKGALKLNRPKP